MTDRRKSIKDLESHLQLFDKIEEWKNKFLQEPEIKGYFEWAANFTANSNGVIPVFISNWGHVVPEGFRKKGFNKSVILLAHDERLYYSAYDIVKDYEFYQPNQPEIQIILIFPLDRDTILNLSGDYLRKFYEEIKNREVYKTMYTSFPY